MQFWQCGSKKKGQRGWFSKKIWGYLLKKSFFLWLPLQEIIFHSLSLSPSCFGENSIFSSQQVLLDFFYLCFYTDHVLSHLSSLIEAYLSFTSKISVICLFFMCTLPQHLLSLQDTQTATQWMLSVLDYKLHEGNDVCFIFCSMA